MTVDKAIILHGVFTFVDYDEWATFSATANVHNDDDSLLMSKTGHYDLVTQDSVHATYRGFDVVFDNGVALRKNVQYCIEVSVDHHDPCFYYGHEDIRHIHCGGVTFSFDDEPNLVAEFLFKIGD